MAVAGANRGIAGPALVALGAWCALGQLTVATADAPAERLAVPAPWYWLVVFFGAAWLVRLWRNRPLAATPALLSVLPWLPLPLPTVALLWTGPLGWLPILLAVLAGGWAGERRDYPSAARLVDRMGPGASALAAGILTLAASLAAAVALDPRLPGGDEPHYLIITQSLLEDGDLRIENNHRARQYAEYFAGDLRPDFIQRGRDEEIYSIHAPGASVLVLPTFALFGYPGAQGLVVALAASAGGLMWLAAWYATGDRRAAWFGTLAVVMTPTFLIQAVTIFPDGPGAFVVAAGLVLILRLARPEIEVSTVGLVGASALVAALPWLHTRFSVLAAGIGLAVVSLIVLDRRRSVAARWRRAAVFLVVPMVSAAGWLLFFYLTYGTPDPRAPYGSDPSTSLAFVPGGLTALFADAQFGLLVYSPVLFAVAAGLLARAPVSTRVVAAGVVAIGVANMAAAATYWMWWAGVPAPPARFAAASLPVFAVPIALAWRHAGVRMRALWRTLLVLSAVSAGLVIGIDRGALAWNVRGVRAAWLDWLSGLVDLSRGWPSFFWELAPTDLSTELHFGGHVAVWAGLIAAATFAFSRVRRGVLERPDVSGLSAAWLVPVMLMVIIQAGWWVNGVSGVTAASSQIAVLGDAARGERVYAVGPWSVVRERSVHEDIHIRATRADPVGEPGAAWLPWQDLPPGRYRVRTVTRVGAGGRLTVRLGRSPAPLVEWAMGTGAEDAFDVALPAGAAAVLLEPDKTFAAAAETVELMLEAPVGVVGTDRATAWARYAGADVYFLENGSVFVEPDGFWVRGGQTARFVLVPQPRSRTATLTLSNGALANRVLMEADGTSETWAAGPWESRMSTVPVTPTGVARWRVTSEGGFRPSEAGGSDDARYLGVRITAGP